MRTRSSSAVALKVPPELARIVLHRVEDLPAVIFARSGRVVDAELVFNREHQPPAGPQQRTAPLQEAQVWLRIGPAGGDVLEHADDDDEVVDGILRNVLEIAAEQLHVG